MNILVIHFICMSVRMFKVNVCTLRNVWVTTNFARGHEMSFLVCRVEVSRLLISAGFLDQQIKNFDMSQQEMCFNSRQELT